MCPICIELKSRNDFIAKVCATGQHKEMLKSVLDIYGAVPDYNLDIMKKN